MSIAPPLPGHLPALVRGLVGAHKLVTAGTASVLVLMAIAAPRPCFAQSLTDPFGEPETSRPAQKPKAPPFWPGDDRPLLAPMDSDERGSSQTQYAPPLPDAEAAENPASRTDSFAPPPAAYETANPQDLVAPSIERTELAPVAAPDGSGLPDELWNGLSPNEVEALLAKLEIPPRSAALHAMWQRLISSSADTAAGQPTSARFTAMRAEVLYRSGLLKQAADVLASDPANASDPMLAAMQARIATALGDRDTACAAIAKLTSLPPNIPTSLKAETGLIGGYCAAAANDMAAAELKASLARDLSPAHAASADALEAIAAGAKPPPFQKSQLSPIDFRILELGKAGLPDDLITHASPALLTLLATDSNLPVKLRLAASEGAASFNAFSAQDLAAAYRAGGTAQDGDAGRRAELYRAAEGERTPARKTRAIRAFLDDAKKAGLYFPALVLMDQPAQQLTATPEIGWFAETAIEAGLAAGNYAGARAWAEFATSLDQPAANGSAAPAPLDHWLALADIADPAGTENRSANLGRLEGLAINGRIPPPVLHRLAAVLDALDIQVPIPLWDKASRTPQPETGHLPETGVLSQLLEASKKKEFGRTVLLSMQALGPDGPDSAHLIALGDSIRALRRANLEADARRLGFEALFGAWPRSAGT